MGTNIKALDDREHILSRCAMYIGENSKCSYMAFLYKNDSIEQTKVKYVPALIKIINEIIDNSLDIAIKTDFEYANTISVKMDSEIVEVRDNGTGIPVVKNEDDKYIPLICWNQARTGSNFQDEQEQNRKSPGYNGVGSYATNCYSEWFTGISDDGKNKYTVKFTDNAYTYKEKISKSTKQGVTVRFKPDVERFNLKEITQDHLTVIMQRLIDLSISFPKITFKFNGKKINVRNFKKYVNLFSEENVTIEDEHYRLGFLSSANDEFAHLSFVNGLKITDGGTHVDYIVDNVVNKLRAKLVKKYKSIKPADIKNKLMFIGFLTDFSNPKFNSQTKEKITNSPKEVSSFYGDIDFDKLANKIYKNKAIMEPIVDYFRIKEEYKKKQELKKLEKPKKKIKSEKYTKAVGENDLLIIAEGQSAKNGLLPGLGRKGIAYYELKGKPMNVYEASQQKFTANKELTELYQIIQNGEFKKIAVASDADLDGLAINGLLLAFFNKYLPEYLENNMVYRFQTPVKALLKKNKMPETWTYNLKGELPNKKGLQFKYFKGLGGFTPEQLKEVILKDGIEKMLLLIQKDEKAEESLEIWYSNSKADKRKEKIMQNDFDLIKL